MAFSDIFTIISTQWVSNLAFGPLLLFQAFYGGQFTWYTLLYSGLMLFRYFLWETPSTFLWRLKKHKKCQQQILRRSIFTVTCTYIFALNKKLWYNTLAFKQRPSLPRSILKDWCEGRLVRTLLGYADANDADVNGRVVLESVANHQGLLLEKRYRNGLNMWGFSLL